MSDRTASDETTEMRLAREAGDLLRRADDKLRSIYSGLARNPHKESDDVVDEVADAQILILRLRALLTKKQRGAA